MFAQSGRTKWILACAVSLFAILAPSMVLAADYATGPAPGWVIPTAAGSATKGQLSKDSDGVSYLLVDTQERHDAETSTRFRRVVSRALNQHGVESVANVEIEFDPSYQVLTLHAVDLVRDGRVIHKLSAANVRVIQRETELDARIFDGMKSANIFLDDVRVGDVVDYAYSVSGRNPVFAGGTFGRTSLQFSVPAARIHVRVLVPGDQLLRVSTLYSSTKPLVTRHGGLLEYTWDVIDDAGLAIEAGAPSRYDPRPAAAFSSYADWNAVARWAQTLYAVPTTLGPTLEAQIARIARSEPTDAGRMLATLRLVQSEVRYLGVEVGVNSHMPNPPSLVFNRKFGDCKDKALLTIALLSRLGIDAHAALVNTTMQQGLAAELPNPGSFDHVIVRAKVGRGEFWLDPTLSEQRSDLAHLVQPDYGLAMVVDPSTTALVAMQSARAQIAKRSLHVVFDARKKFDKPVGYTITTTYEGREADLMRAGMASRSLVDMQKNYLNWYSSYYPHISVTAPLEVHDDEVNNRLTVSEHYQIADIATKSDQVGKLTVAILTVDFDSLFNVPDVRIRKSPLSLAHPLTVEQTTEVLLPSAWPIKPETDRVVDPAFRFEQSVRLDGLRLVITGRYESLAKEIPAGEMTRYLANLTRVRENLDYSLSWTDPTAGAEGTPSNSSEHVQRGGLDRINWPVTMLALALVAIWGWAAVLLYRYDPPPRDAGSDSVEGLGGWLALIGFGLVASPFFVARALLDLTDALSAETWTALTTFGGASYHVLWAPLMMFELATNLGQLVFAILLLVLFFQRRTCFPRLMIAFYLSAAGLQGADTLLSNLLPTITVTSADYASMVRALVTSIIWSIYLARSRRVKATFVRRYGGQT